MAAAVSSSQLIRNIGDHSEMGHHKRDGELDEVKEILLRLQQVELEEGGDAPQQSETQASHIRPDQGAGGEKSERGEKYTGVVMYTGAAVFGACLIGIVAAYMFLSDDFSGSGPAEPTQANVSGKTAEDAGSSVTPESGAGPAAGTASVRKGSQGDGDELAEGLETGQKHLLAGDVEAARQVLLPLAEAGSDQAALALARSYDPNFLRSVSSPDTAANVSKAEHWYRKWRDLAGERGLVMDESRFERIISSMQ